MRTAVALALALALAASSTPAHADDDVKASMAALAKCQAGFDAGAADVVATCTEATTRWPGNHRAWYYLGRLAAGRDWAQAAQRFARAVDGDPAEPMYQMWLGVAVYEKGDPASAGPHLDRALAGNAGLWRARYYRGRVLRAARQWREAAQELTRAITAHPDFAPTYLELVDLYRRWDYTREAIKIAGIGTQRVTDPVQRQGLWLVLGQAHAAAQNEDAAIEAFDRVIESSPAHAEARALRGLALYRKGDLAGARTDLDATRDAPDLDALTRQAIADALKDIARRRK